LETAPEVGVPTWVEPLNRVKVTVPLFTAPDELVTVACSGTAGTPYPVSELKALVVVLASTVIVSLFEGVGPTPAPFTPTLLR
jgi:hypothetical protein